MKKFPLLMVSFISTYKKRLLVIVGFGVGIGVLIYLSLVIYVGRMVYEDTKVASDVIIVLGARSYLGGQYNPCLVSRVSHAVELYQQKYAPKIVVSGGNDVEDQVNEAETMRKIAVEQGVPETDILLEVNATSTFENLAYAKQIMDSANMKRAIIVTEGFHSARASLVADKVGIEHTLSSATDSSCWSRWKYLSRYFLKEPFAIMQYKLKGRI